MSRFWAVAAEICKKFDFLDEIEESKKMENLPIEENHILGGEKTGEIINKVNKDEEGNFIENGATVQQFLEQFIEGQSNECQYEGCDKSFQNRKAYRDHVVEFHPTPPALTDATNRPDQK